MMKDWTDIIGEELESIQEPLPADDWKVLQQKYAASRRRKRVAAFAWAGGIASAAAIVVLALLLMRPDVPVDQEELVADVVSLSEVIDEKSAVSNDSVYADIADVDSSPADVPADHGESSAGVSHKVAEDNKVEGKGNDIVAEDIAVTDNRTVEGEKEKVVGMLIDTAFVVEKLVAQARHPEKEKEMVASAWDLEELPEDKTEKMQGRGRNPISIGITGAVTEEFAFGFSEASPDVNTPPVNNIPADTLVQEKHMLYTKGGLSSEYYDAYNHDIPVTFGISARYFFSERFAVNTGINYTRYTSTRKRYNCRTGAEVSVDRQNVHYLGIPLRLDLMLVNRKHFNLYMGGGVSAEKCVWATVGGERLRERELIVSSVFTAGVQLNIVPSVGLYFEPYVTRTLKQGTLPTYRDDLMISAQGGLRFNF